MQPAALCQGRADVKLTNTGESSQLRTVSGDVLGNAAMRRHSFHKGIPSGTPEEWDHSSRWPPRKPVVLWDWIGVLSSASRPATGKALGSRGSPGGERLQRCCCT